MSRDFQTPTPTGRSSQPRAQVPQQSIEEHDLIGNDALRQRIAEEVGPGEAQGADPLGAMGQMVTGLSTVETGRNALEVQQVFGDLVQPQTLLSGLGDMPSSGALGQVGTGLDVLGTTMDLATILVDEGGNMNSLESQLAATNIVATAIAQCGPWGQVFSIGWAIGSALDDAFDLSDRLATFWSGGDSGAVDMEFAQLVDRLAGAGWGAAIVLEALWELREVYRNAGAAHLNAQADALGQGADSSLRAYNFREHQLAEIGRGQLLDQAATGLGSTSGGSDQVMQQRQLEVDVPTADRVQELVEEGEDFLRDKIAELQEERRRQLAHQRGRQDLDRLLAQSQLHGQVEYSAQEYPNGMLPRHLQSDQHRNGAFVRENPHPWSSGRHAEWEEQESQRVELVEEWLRAREGQDFTGPGGAVG